MAWLTNRKRTFKISINPEVNYGSVFMEYALQSKWASNILHEEKYDGVTLKRSKEPGFTTTSESKPIIMAIVQQYIDSGLQVDKNQANEIKKYSLNSQGKMEAIAGWHDDEVISCALALYSVRQGTPGGNYKFF